MRVQHVARPLADPRKPLRRVRLKPAADLIDGVGRDEPLEALAAAHERTRAGIEARLSAR